MTGLDPVLHQAVRLRLMAMLLRNRHATFVALRDSLEVTDGNLATHLARLVEAGYIAGRRTLVGVSFQVRYWPTDFGRKAFASYAERLRSILEDAT